MKPLPSFNGILRKGVVKYRLSANDIMLIWYINKVFRDETTHKTFNRDNLPYFYLSPRGLWNQLEFLFYKSKSKESRERSYQRMIKSLVDRKILIYVVRKKIHKGVAIYNRFYRFDKEAFISLFTHNKQASNLSYLSTEQQSSTTY